MFQVFFAKSPLSQATTGSVAIWYHKQDTLGVLTGVTTREDAIAEVSGHAPDRCRPANRYGEGARDLVKTAAFIATRQH